VVDGQQALFQDEQHILGCSSWPADLCLRIWSETPESAILHRCSFRDVTEADIKPLSGWIMPRTELALKPEETAERLSEQKLGLPNPPKNGARFRVTTTDTPMAWVPAGEFMMGPTNANSDQRHKVKLTRGFWMGQYEVTQKEWTTLIKVNPSHKRGSPYLPVDWVSWEDAMHFCNALTIKERTAKRLPTGYEYRLPTEAEWEYACRAGTTDEFSIPGQDVWCGERGDRRPHESANALLTPGDSTTCTATPWNGVSMLGTTTQKTARPPRLIQFTLATRKR